MGIFDDDEIEDLHRAATTAGLAGSRGALLMGMDRGVADGIPDAPSPAAQLQVDLRTLNEIGLHAGRTAPIVVWLTNAEMLAGPRREAGMFRSARVTAEQRLRLAGSEKPRN